MPTSNEEEEVICEIDGLVLGSVQFGVLVWVLIGVLFEALMAVRAHLFKIDGRVIGGMQLELLVQVVFWDGRLGARGGAVWGARFGVLLKVLVCNHCYLGSMLVYFFRFFGWQEWEAPPFFQDLEHQDGFKGTLCLENHQKGVPTQQTQPNGMIGTHFPDLKPRGPPFRRVT